MTAEAFGRPLGLGEACRIPSASATGRRMATGGSSSPFPSAPSSTGRRRSCARCWARGTSSNTIRPIDARETRGAPGSIDAASGDKMRFAMKNWAAVMTAHGQLFESLFCALPSRKLHDIAGSSIVLDEAKTLPRGLLVPTVRMIGEIARNYGCSIVPCTATRPAQVSSFLSGPSPWRRRRPWCGGWRRAWRRGSSSGTWRWLR